MMKLQREEYGTVEGRLQTPPKRRGVHFAIFDELTDQAVRCNVARERLDEAWQAVGRRVAVSEMIRYLKDGNPVSIRAETIFVFPKDDDLPTADDVYGIGVNILDTVAHLVYFLTHAEEEPAHRIRPDDSQGSDRVLQ